MWDRKKKKKKHLVHDSAIKQGEGRGVVQCLGFNHRHEAEAQSRNTKKKLNSALYIVSIIKNAPAEERARNETGRILIKICFSALNDIYFLFSGLCAARVCSHTLVSTCCCE